MPFNGCLVPFLQLGDGLGGVNRSVGVVGRGINGIQLYRRVPDIGDIVPGARGYKNGGIVKGRLAEGQIIPGVTHLHQALAAFHTQELVGVGVHFQADILAGEDGHKGALEVLPRPQGGAEILVLQRGGIDVCYIR